jgi:hypothetical protein
MQIGKAGNAVTSISAASKDAISVRGKDLTSELMGQPSFTESIFLDIFAGFNRRTRIGTNQSSCAHNPCSGPEFSRGWGGCGIVRWLRDCWVATTEVELVAHAALPRSDYKSKLVDWPTSPTS